MNLGVLGVGLLTNMMSMSGYSCCRSCILFLVGVVCVFEMAMLTSCM